MKEIMYESNGQFPNGMNKPMRKVVILRNVQDANGMTDHVYIRYCDTGERGYTYKRLLRNTDK